MHTYYLRWDRGILEMRQARYKLLLEAGRDHLNDVCAVARSKEELRSMLDACKIDHAQVDWDSTPDQPESPTTFGHVVHVLRNDHRIKMNVDYAVVVKYNLVHVLVSSVYEDTVREVFDKCGVPVESWNTFPST